ncbi:MAG: hypothetical protein M0Z55_13835 [Peptococcaceae bacterium]|nr:hypothetical protein [Peptococcaceae bacterium]
MQSEAVIQAIATNPALFAVDELVRIEVAKIKTSRLPSQFAYFQGGSQFHRVAVVCPVKADMSHESELVAGLLWANKVSNGQKTVLYIVGEGFSPLFSYLVKMFGPRVEIRLAYYTPSLAQTFVISNRKPETEQIRFRVSRPQEPLVWAEKFNPVEKMSFQAAINYFSSYSKQGIYISCMENWVSVKYKGLEVVRINKKENRLRIALITRLPREIRACPGGREELEGWMNAQGELNADFVGAFKQRLTQLDASELFSRVCPKQQQLEYTLLTQSANLGLCMPLYTNLDIAYSSDHSVNKPIGVDVLARSQAGKLVSIVIHPYKDLMGVVHSLLQLTWLELDFANIAANFFPADCTLGAEVWLVCPQEQINPNLDILRSLVRSQEQIRVLTVDALIY